VPPLSEPAFMDTIVAKKFDEKMKGKSIGGWPLTSFIGSGKAAIVYRSESARGISALKVFDPELVERYGGSTVQLERIGRELLLRGKKHPNLVQILDGGQCSVTGMLYVAMEYLNAPNLAEAIMDVPRDQIAFIINQIASAARFLENQGLAHRDIKPDNIVVTENFRRAVLLDLGVLRPFGEAGLTDVDHRPFIGTLQYSSPEFLLRQEEDTPAGWRAVTFYQLGAVLHDLINKRRIFAEFCEPYANLARAVQYEIPKINSPDVSPDLVFLALNCLNKDPKLRLDLVKWQDFEPRVDTPSIAMQAKERIRRRQAHAASLSGTDDRDTQRRSHSLRQKLSEVKIRVETYLREICLADKIIPPHEVHELVNTEQEKAATLLLIRPSGQLNLRWHIHLWLVVQFLDEAADVVEIQKCMALANKAMIEKYPEAEKFQLLFRGSFQEDMVRTHFQNLIYPLLDKGYEVDFSRVAGDAAHVEWLSDRVE
jgi:eukaryotic-like serine/threonine-protein kinase